MAVWNKNDTHRLIQLYKSNEDLWNHTRDLYNNREHKSLLCKNIADELKREVKDVEYKWFNIKCQFNSIMREVRQKKKTMKSVRWEYFVALQFLNSNNSPNKSKPVTNKSEELNVSSTSSKNSKKPPAKKQKAFPPSKKRKSYPTIEGSSNHEDQENVSSSSSSDLWDLVQKENKNVPPSKKQKQKAVSPSKKPKLQTANETSSIVSEVQPVPTPPDSHQIFGQFMANQMRNMSESKRKRLKIAIFQKMVQIQEEPEVPVGESVQEDAKTAMENELLLDIIDVVLNVKSGLEAA